MSNRWVDLPSVHSSRFRCQAFCPSRKRGVSPWLVNRRSIKPCVAAYMKEVKVLGCCTSMVLAKASFDATFAR